MTGPTQLQNDSPNTAKFAGSIALADLKNVRIAVLAADGFDQVDLSAMAAALEKQGARLELLAPSQEGLHQGIQSFHSDRPNEVHRPERLIQDAQPGDFQVLLVPGGLLSLERMKESRFHTGFIQSFLDTGKPVVAVGHAPWLLTDSGMIQGKTVTSRPTIRRDLERAGAIWKDLPVVVDSNLITCRDSTEAGAVCRELSLQLARGPGMTSPLKADVA